MKSIPLSGKIAMVTAITGIAVGLVAFLFFELESGVYNSLIFIFELMWGMWFLLYVIAFTIHVGGRKK